MPTKKHASTPRINKGKKKPGKPGRLSKKDKLTLEIAARISKLRLTNAETQEDMAARMQVKLSSVKAWELGNNRPTLENLQKITALYNVTYEYLIEGIEPSDEKVKATEYNRMAKERIYLLDYIEHLRGKK